MAFEFCDCENAIASDSLRQFSAQRQRHFLADQHSGNANYPLGKFFGSRGRFEKTSKSLYLSSDFFGSQIGGVG
jgi:hypothetical protein